MKKSYAENRVARWMSALILIALLAGTRMVLAGNDAADEASASIRPEAIRADMRFLADDLLEGRGTGTRGHELAAKYMAARFEQMGLHPGGDPGRTESSVEAEVVFVGDGVTAPEQGYDDYKGVEVKGKIVAMLPEAPNF